MSRWSAFVKIPFSYAILAIIAINCITNPGNISAQVTEEWVANNLGPVLIAGSAFAMDAAGNFYMTGRQWIDAVGKYVTTKYDPNANEVWVARYNGPESIENIPAAIAVDKPGNVYVTGRSAYSDGNDKLTTIKYDMNGNELWVAQYNNAVNNGGDPFVLLSLDNAGNIFVSGWAWNQDGSYSGYFALIKYDENGNELWVARLDTQLFALATDKSGNVYGTGSGSSSAYFTIKYDPNGNILWTSSYIADQYERPAALFIDDLDNVYVTGGYALTGSATIKYNSNGSELWVARSDNCDLASLAVDGEGNVYGTGGSLSYFDYSFNSIVNDFVTIKYDPSGNELWMALYNGSENQSDSACAIALDPDGNVYVTGIFDFHWLFFPDHSTYYGDIGTIKYNRNGSEIWVYRYNGPGNDKDSGQAISVDGNGNVYVFGYSFPASSNMAVIIKLAQEAGGAAVGGGGHNGGGSCFIGATFKQN